MPINTDRLSRALSQYGKKFRQKEPVYLAEIVSRNTDGTYEVIMLNPDYSHAMQRTVRGSGNYWPGLIVRLSIDHQRYDDSKLVIMGVDSGTYYGTRPPSTIELHGETHGYNRVDETNNLYTWQIYPLRVQPNSGMEVDILPGLYYADGEHHELGDTETLDLTAYKPAAGWCYVTVSIDADGNIHATKGSDVGSPSAEDIPDAPIGDRPLAAVLLQAADTTIPRSRMSADLRWLAGGMGSGAGGSSNCLFTQTADKTVGNTAVETTLVTTGVGSLAMPVNYLVAGRTLRLLMKGHISTAYSGTPSASVSPSASESPSESPSQSPSASVSPSISPSESPSASVSPSISPSLSPSASASPSESPSQSPSASLSPSPSASESASESPSQSPSASLSPSASASASESPSVSPSLSPSPAIGTWEIKFRVKLNGNVVMETDSIAYPQSMSQDGFELEGLITCRTVGAAGTAMSQGYVTLGNVNEYGGIGIFDMVNTAADAVDTTAAQTLDVTVEWGAAAAANTITSTNFAVTVLN